MSKLNKNNKMSKKNRNNYKIESLEPRLMMDAALASDSFSVRCLKD